MLSNYFPALVKGYVILELQLGPLDGLQCFQIYHFQIDIEKLALYMCIVSSFLEKGLASSLMRVKGCLVTRSSYTLEMTPWRPKIPKFKFLCKN